MAKYKHTKTETEKIQIEGEFDANTLSFDVDGEIIDLKDKVQGFHGKKLSLTLTEKIDEEIE